MDRKIKAFLIYAYSFIFLYMLNSLLMWFSLRASLPTTIVVIVEAVIMITGLFFSFRAIIGKYYGIKDDKKVAKAWLIHFIPFVITSYLLLFFVFSLVKIPSLAIFLYLNLDVVVLFFTFKFAVEKFIERNYD